MEQSDPGARNTYSTICSLGLVTIGSIKVSYVVCIYGSRCVPLISQCFVIRGSAQQV
jgi:hypothetical protein